MKPTLVSMPFMVYVGSGNIMVANNSQEGGPPLLNIGILINNTMISSIILYHTYGPSIFTPLRGYYSLF